MTSWDIHLDAPGKFGGLYFNSLEIECTTRFAQTLRPDIDVWQLLLICYSGRTNLELNKLEREQANFGKPAPESQRGCWVRSSVESLRLKTSPKL